MPRYGSCYLGGRRYPDRIPVWYHTPLLMFSWFNSDSVGMAGHDHFLQHPLQESVRVILFLGKIAFDKLFPSNQIIIFSYNYYFWLILIKIRNVTLLCRRHVNNWAPKHNTAEVLYRLGLLYRNLTWKHMFHPSWWEYLWLFFSYNHYF
jgi:hypothetical protein